MDFNLPYVSQNHDYVLVDTSALEYRSKPVHDDKRLKSLRRVLGKFSVKPPIDERIEYASLMRELFDKNFYVTTEMTHEYEKFLGHLGASRYLQGKRLSYRNMMHRIVRKAVKHRVFPFSQADEDAKKAISGYFDELRHNVSGRDIDLIFSAFALSHRGPTAVLTNDRELVDTFKSVAMHISLANSHPAFSGLQRTSIYSMLGSEEFYKIGEYKPKASQFVPADSPVKSLPGTI